MFQHRFDFYRILVLINQLIRHHVCQRYAYTNKLLEIWCKAQRKAARDSKSYQARRELKRGPGKHSCGPRSKHFYGSPQRKIFLHFFQNGTF